MDYFPESSGNRLARVFIHLLSVFFMAFSLLHSYQGLIHHSFLAAGGLIPFLIGLYLFRRISKLIKISIETETLVFKYMFQTIPVKFGNIESIRKLNTYTFTDDYWMAVTFRKEHNKKNFRFLFLSEPEHFTIETFKRLGIPVKSIFLD